MSSTRKPLPSALKRKIKPRRFGLLISPDRATEIQAQWAEEDYAKLQLLAEHYSIPPDNNRWLTLCLCLAQEFIAGFQEGDGPGNDTKWGDYTLGILAVEMERQIAGNKFSRSGTLAAKSLARRHPWKTMLEKGKHKTGGALDTDALAKRNAAALKRQYEYARKTVWADVCRDAFHFHQQENTVARWDQLVDELAKKLAT